MHAILKQIAQQLKGYSNSSDDEAYTLLYPFDSSRDYYSTPWKAFTDPRNGKEYILKYNNDEDRLAKLKKINTAITSYNKVATKNYKEFISKLPSDGKVHSPDEFGFKKPTLTINEIPLWGFSVIGRTGKDNSHKTVTIDNRKLYQLRLGLNDDSEFITHLNCQIFKHIQTKRKESEKMRTWDMENIWYKPNQKFHKWFQLKNIDPYQYTINRDETIDALWAIADDMRARKDNGEFNTYREAYRWAEKNISKKGLIITANSLERAYHKAKSEGKVGEQKTSKVSIPLMITNKMRMDLLTLGWSKDEMKHLTPEQCWEIINKGVPKKPSRERGRNQ